MIHCEGGHHATENWGCPDTVDTNGLTPMRPNVVLW